MLCVNRGNEFNRNQMAHFNKCQNVDWMACQTYFIVALSQLTRRRPLPPHLQKWSNSYERYYCAETNEKSIFRILRFLFFELWSIVFTIYSMSP